MRGQLRRLSKPTRVLLLLIPVFFCIACLVEWGRIEAHDCELRSAYFALNMGAMALLMQKLQEEKIDQEDLCHMLWWEADQTDSERSVKILIKIGVNTNTKDGEGRTAMQIAENRGNREVVRLLHQVKE